MQLKGKVAVVTGAGRGVGRAVALAFAAEGARVALAARSRDEIESAATAIREAGGTALPVVSDVGRESDVKGLFACARAELGPVDVLVNNAAHPGPVGPAWRIDPEEWMEMLNVGLVGLARCTSAALPDMLERRRGKIINVGSKAGIQAFDGIAPYSTLKAAVNHYSRCLAEELRPHGINVNAVGVIAHTRMVDQHAQGRAAARGDPLPPSCLELPPGQHVWPEENSALFVFLASDASDHITGQYIEANSLYGYIRRNDSEPHPVRR
ncbi:MAG: SDR family oxidoreductase [Planctomycetes bacterium]|nr:SDR family oxidoreductase [Planctomycetota bacterium]